MLRLLAHTRAHRLEAATLLIALTSVAATACRRNKVDDDKGPLAEVARGRVAKLNLTIVGADGLPRPRAKRGELIQAEVTLANASRHPLWINKRLAVNSDEVLPMFREIWLKVLGPKQKPVAYHCVSDVAFPNEDDYVVLKPGDRVRTVEELTCFDFSVPGTYVLMARYQDGNEHPPAPPAGATHLFEEFESAKVTLEIVQ
jgi:hypothetical protein